MKYENTITALIERLYKIQGKKNICTQTNDDPNKKKDSINFNRKDELVSFNIGLSLWIKIDSS